MILYLAITCLLPPVAGNTFPYTLSTDSERSSAQLLALDGQVSTGYRLSGITAVKSVSGFGYPTIFGAMSKNQCYLGVGTIGSPSGRSSIHLPFALFTGSYLIYRDGIYLTSGQMFESPKPNTIVSCDPAPTDRGFALLLFNEISGRYSISIFDGQTAIRPGTLLPRDKRYSGLCWDRGALYVLSSDDSHFNVEKFVAASGSFRPCFSTRLPVSKNISPAPSVKQLGAVRSLLTIVNKGREMYYILGNETWYRALPYGSNDWSAVAPKKVLIGKS